MLQIKGYQQHITALHPSIERALIVPIGSWVAVFHQDTWQIGRIHAYGFSGYVARETEKVYTIRGWRSITNQLYGWDSFRSTFCEEFSFEDMVILDWSI